MVLQGKEGLSETVHGQSEILGDSVMGSASTSGGDGEESLASKEIKRTGDGMGRLTESSGELVSDFVVTGKAAGCYYGLKKNRSLRIRSNGYSFKALNSIGSCSLAQVVLYGEHARVEEDAYSSCTSPCILTLRPLLVHFNEVWLESEENEVERKCGLKESQEELLGSFEQRNWKQNMEKAHRRRRRRRCSSSTTRVSDGQFHSQGSPNGMLLFFVGITVGIMYTIIAHKREVDKLNELLKHTQKLVQDLHEEVEMKDSFKLEFRSEGFESQGTEKQTSLNGTPTALSTEQEWEKIEKSEKCVSKKLNDQRVDDTEGMSKIEAEIQAELELLELNIKTYSLNRISDDVELDPEPNHDVRVLRGTPTNYIHRANKAVSPRELSLRLYEVIESRLEARIMELETALEDREKRVPFHGFGICNISEGLQGRIFICSRYPNLYA